METKYVKELEKKKKELEEKLKIEKSRKLTTALIKKPSKKKMFFEFTQNNSGGSFTTNDKLCHRIVIEGYSYEETREKALEMGIYFDGCDLGLDCSCCGDRWSDYDDTPLKIKDKWKMGVYDHYKEPEKLWDKLYGDYEIVKRPKWSKDGFKKFEGEIRIKSISEYCQLMADEYGWTSPDARVFFLNGKIKEFFKNDNKKKE